MRIASAAFPLPAPWRNNATTTKTHRVCPRVCCGNRRRQLVQLSWSDQFEDPVPGMTTLRHAANYIEKLPNAQQAFPHWQTAVEMLIRAIGGSAAWLLMARIAVLQALNRANRACTLLERKRTRGSESLRGINKAP